MSHKISIRLLVDKEQQRVVFAESRSDFIGILFSFLTLPLGRIVRLLGKQSGLGSLDNLYESVEQLDDELLQTETCKKLLLNPRSSAAMECEDLKIKDIHGPHPRTFYICNEKDCLIRSKCYYTYVQKARCISCGQLMNRSLSWSKDTREEEGVFVEDKSEFIITDDLRVIPISLMSGFSLLEELKIKDANALEGWDVDVDSEKALNLLRRSLISKRALTEVFLPDACIAPTVNCSSVIKEEIDGSEAKEEQQQFNVKIILNKKKNIVLYAEVGKDFADQLLSFLTFPFGSVIRLLGDRISLEGCINNLWSSAETLNMEHFKSEKCKNMLVFSKLASYYGCRKQMLNLDEVSSKKWTCSGSCAKCYLDSTTAPCMHGIKEAEFKEQDPHLELAGTNYGEGFADDERRFMISDNLHISPISSIFTILKGIDFLIPDLVEKDVSVDKDKVLSLLNAMLISNTVLTDVFLSKSTPQRRY